jgi:hypothetical protein
MSAFGQLRTSAILGVPTSMPKTSLVGKQCLNGRLFPQMKSGEPPLKEFFCVLTNVPLSQKPRLGSCVSYSTDKGIRLAKCLTATNLVAPYPQMVAREPQSHHSACGSFFELAQSRTLTGRSLATVP